MMRRMFTASIGMAAVAALVFLTATTASAGVGVPDTLPGGGGSDCQGTGHAQGTTVVFDQVIQTACYSDQVGFYAYTALPQVCQAMGYEATVFLGKNQQRKVFDEYYCDDGNWHYTQTWSSNVLLSTWMQIYWLGTNYQIVQLIG